MMNAAIANPTPEKKAARTMPAPSPEQEAAAKMVMEGNALAQIRLATTAFVKLMRDPNDTEQVFVMGLAVSRPFFPRFLARFATSADGDRLLRERPAIDSRSVDYDGLRALPADTLGGAYVRHLDDNGLDPDLFQPPPKSVPPVAAYISQRMRQTHDIWHALTGYQTDPHSEASLLAFSYAQTGFPIPGIIALGATVKDGGARKNLDGYRRGKAASYMPSVHWESRWEQPLADIRRELGIRPARNA